MPSCRRLSAISIPWSRAPNCSACRSRACPRFAARLARWTDRLFPGEVPADRRLRLAVCALSDIAWRDHPDVRAEESFRRLLQFPFIGIDHAERVFMALAIHARYAGAADARWLEPAVSLLSPSLRRRAMILGRTLLLGYRFSGGVPEIWPVPACTSVPISSAWRWAVPPASRTARWSATGSGSWRPPSACGGRRSSRPASRGSPE